MSQFQPDELDLLRSMAKMHPPPSVGFSPELVAQHCAGVLSDDEERALMVEASRSIDRSGQLFESWKTIKSIKASEATDTIDLERYDSFVATVVRAWLLLTVYIGPAAKRMFESDEIFIGRVQEQRELHKVLSDEGNSIVTITGPSGIGKTVIARRIAISIALLYPGGIWRIDCTGFDRLQTVQNAIAQELGLSEEETTASLISEQTGDKSTLMMFENVENSEPVIDVIQQLSAQCKRLTFLVTKQTALGVEGESEFALGPIGTGHGTHELSEAASLFVASAQVRRPDTRITGQDSQTIEDICKMLDGSPLAITLTAGRLGMNSLNELFDQTSKQLERESSRHHVAPQSIRLTDIVLSDCIDSLSIPALSLLTQFSIFSEALDISDVRTVSDLDEDGLRLALEELFDRSLINYGVHDGRPVISLVARDSIRELLPSASEQISNALRRFQALNLDRARRISEKMNTGHWQSGLALLSRYSSDLSTAIGRAAQEGTNTEVIEFSNALLRTYFETGRNADFELLSSAAMSYASSSEDAEFEIGLLGLLGAAKARAGDNDAGSALWERRLNISRSTGDIRNLADTLNDLASLALDEGKYEQALALAKDAETASNEENVPELIATAWIISARACRAKGELAEARNWAEQTKELIEDATDMDLALFVLQSLALCYQELENDQQALELAQRALELALEGNLEVHIGLACGLIAEIFESSGEIESAVLYHLQASNVHRDIGSRHAKRAREKLEAVSRRHPGQSKSVLDEYRDVPWKDLLYKRKKH